jgi:ubiquinone/menaquinone biosynthesis C-methylase UbiE
MLRVLLINTTRKGAMVMPDIFANITHASPAIVEVIAQTLELRATLPQYQAILRAYLSEIVFPPNARVLEVGCGTGAVARFVARWPNVGDVVGVDPSPALLDKARSLSAGMPMLSFHEADGKALPFPAHSFDVVVLHTVLTHVPGPDALLAEVWRVLRPQGSVGIGDGDFSTATVALGDDDPLQTCVAAFVENFVHDPWLVRRVSALARAAGFDVSPLRSYGIVETLNPSLTPTWVERGAEARLGAGYIGAELAAALKAEARRRVAEGSWFGYMAYASLIARKPE